MEFSPIAKRGSLSEALMSDIVKKLTAYSRVVIHDPKKKKNTNKTKKKVMLTEKNQSSMPFNFGCTNSKISAQNS